MKPVKKTPKKKVPKAKKPAPEKKPRGRPTVFSEAAAVAVLEGIMGGDCLAVVCAPEMMPAKRTWMYWVARDGKLQERYVAAMAIRTLNRAEECIPIADDADEKSKAGLLKARLRINARQWEIQRLMPKVYGRDGWNGIAETGGEVQADADVMLRLAALRKGFGHEK